MLLFRVMVATVPYRSLRNSWPGDDYDTIWTITIDDDGNLTVNNDLCEGIDTEQLPVTAPQF